jgi:hypothetical protein
MCVFHSNTSDVRTLPASVNIDGSPFMNSVETCTSTCGAANYTLAGVEFGSECCTYFTSSLR